MHKPIEMVVLRLPRVLPSGKAAALSPAEQARAASFRLEEDRRRYVGSHLMLRSLLAERAGCPGLRFSLSRCGELAAFAFASGRAVGIDIEAIRPLAEADLIAEQSFPSRERRAYEALPPGERTAGFYRGWTRTEALAKALGGGLSMGRDALDEALEAGWRLRSFVPAPNFCGAIAAPPLS